MFVELIKEWREYQPGDIIEVNDAIGATLIKASAAKNYQTEKTEAKGLEQSLQFKSSELSRVNTMISYHENELVKLKEKKELLVDAIKELRKSSDNGAQEEKEKKGKLNRKQEV